MAKKTVKAPEVPDVLLQVRVTEAERRFIKTWAANQGMTLREAVLSAFAAWTDKLRSQK